MVKLAILIPAYNCGATVGETLASLQQIESGWEYVDQVIVCDDCSTDNTLQIVQSTGFNRSQLSILTHKKNLGEAVCYRSMVANLKPDTDWFLILHADDIALPCFLTKNVEIIKRNDERVAAVSSNYYTFGDGCERLAYSPPEDRVVFRSDADEEIRHSATIGCWWHISGSLVNRKLWEQFGGRSTDLPQVGDWDLILRWQIGGYRVGHSLVPTTKSRIHSLSVSSRSYREFRDLKERTAVICDNPAVFTSQVRRKWMSQIAKSGARRIIRLALARRIADARRGVPITLSCVMRLANLDGPRWLTQTLTFRYKIKMYKRWAAEFGIGGLWRLLCSKASNRDLRVKLKSKHFGYIVCRNCPEDFSAVNSVMCSGAYAAPFGENRFESVLDLGAHVGIATRYFLSQEPKAQVLAVEPSSENCAMFRTNMEIAAVGGRVRLWECGIGRMEGVGYLHPDEGRRFDSFRVEYSAKDIINGDQPVPIQKMASALQALPGRVLVKMDIEGSEDEVLVCREEWIGRVSYMMVEFHDRTKEKLWISILRAEGWKCHKHFDTWHFEPELGAQDTKTHVA